MKLDSEPPYEDSLVLWLQAGCWYADIRVNLVSGEIYSGFGGVVWWRQPRLWFQHLINISGTLSDKDIGEIVLSRFGCFEYGTFERNGRMVFFEEKWQLRRSQFSLVYTLSRRGVLIGLEVQTDRYCILIVKDKIKLFARRGPVYTRTSARHYGQWRTVHSNTPRENCWQPTAGSARPEWQLREVATSP